MATRTLATLIGSEKQVEWATEIRVAKLEAIDAFLDESRSKVEVELSKPGCDAATRDKAAAFIDKLGLSYAIVTREDDSRCWILWKDWSPMAILRRAFDKHGRA